MCLVVRGPAETPADVAALGMAPDLGVESCPARFAEGILSAKDVVQVQIATGDRPITSPLRPADAGIPFFTDPKRWEADGHRGYLIRSYLNPQPDGWPGADLPPNNFIHVRGLTRVRSELATDVSIARGRSGSDASSTTSDDSGAGSVPLAGKRAWADIAWFRHLSVDEATLERVYATAGFERRWLDGARGVVMPHAAWAVLEEWWEAKGRLS